MHSNSVPMEKSCKKYVRHIDIPEEAIPSAKRLLECSGINEDPVFPDLEGFGQLLKQRYSV